MMRQVRFPSYLIEDGSYIRLKQLELGYTLPKQTLSKIGLQQCRVYLNAENLLTLTKYNNIDPEVKNGDDKNMGVDYMNNMPLARDSPLVSIYHSNT